MSIDTSVAREREAMSENEYDAQVKAFLSEKQILARIMKGCVEEYRDCTIEEIADRYIEGIPEVGSVRVGRDESNTVPIASGSRITGLSTEDRTFSEGDVFYDIRFVAAAPSGDGLIRLIINVEAQRNDRPGYPLVKRGIYYCSRLISAQKTIEFEQSNYGDLRKVYSIWICQHPSAERNTVTRYRMRKEDVIGSTRDVEKDYDLLQVIMIRLGQVETTQADMLHFLNVAFSDSMSTEEKRSVSETAGQRMPRRSCLC